MGAMDMNQRDWEDVDPTGAYHPRKREVYNRCPQCGHYFPTLEDEVGAYACPQCGTYPNPNILVQQKQAGPRPPGCIGPGSVYVPVKMPAERDAAYLEEVAKRVKWHEDLVERVRRKEEAAARRKLAAAQ